MRRGPLIFQTGSANLTTSLLLLAIIWRLAQGPETAACPASQLKARSSMPAPLEDGLGPCPGCDNLQRSHTLQRRWTALRVELTLGRLANVPPDFPAFHSGEERAAKNRNCKWYTVPLPQPPTPTPTLPPNTPLYLNIAYIQFLISLFLFLKG